MWPDVHVGHMWVVELYVLFTVNIFSSYLALMPVITTISCIHKGLVSNGVGGAVSLFTYLHLWL